MSAAQPVDFAELSLRLRPLPWLSRLLGKSMTLYYQLIGKDKYDDFRLERVYGAPFVIAPSVFNPKLLRTGEFFASQINATLLERNWDVLDMGTGSGVCAVFAARHARRVLAVDINPAAARCANLNALLNQLEHRIEVRWGDLFTPVAAERFDLILFNPPFVRGSPRDDRDRAWRSTDVAERFAANLGAHLKPGGFALVLLSSFGDGQFFLEQFRAQNFKISMWAERRFVNERLTLFKLMPAAG